MPTIGNTHRALAKPHSFWTLVLLLILLTGTQCLEVEGLLDQVVEPILKAEKGAERVKVVFFMETLCPYCAQFTTHVLSQMKAEGLFDIMELTMVPFGNAKWVNSTYVCQHGAAECEGNRMELCVIHAYPGQDHWFPFVDCFERYFPATRNANVTATACAKLSDVKLAATLACAYGSQGLDLEDAAYQHTASLQPPHTFVPWILVNGVPACTMDQGCADVPKIICAAYSGEKPEACANYSTTPATASAAVALGLTSRRAQHVCMSTPELIVVEDYASGKPELM